MFYPWFWKALPGNALVKTLTVAAILVGLIWLLFNYVFPALDLFLASDPTIEN